MVMYDFRYKHAKLYNVDHNTRSKTNTLGSKLQIFHIIHNQSNRKPMYSSYEFTISANLVIY